MFWLGVEPAYRAKALPTELFVPPAIYQIRYYLSTSYSTESCQPELSTKVPLIERWHVKPELLDLTPDLDIFD